MTEHNHELYTKEEIDFKAKNKIVSLPDNVQNEAYNSFEEVYDAIINKGKDDRSILMKEDDKTKSVSFTFVDQVQKCNYSHFPLLSF